MNAERYVTRGGIAVHRTVEDLHEWLRTQAEAGRRVS